MNFGSNRQAAILTDEGLTLINPTTGVVLMNMSGHIVDIVRAAMRSRRQTNSLFLLVWVREHGC